MEKPNLSFAASRPGLAARRELDLLIRVEAPALPEKAERMPANLALVLDRSGSMAGQKLAYARQGASAAVSLLGPQDRVSLVQFDDRVKLLHPLTQAGDAGALQSRIAGIEAGGQTDLHGGWAAGAASLAGDEAERGARRVVLLTDGLANKGVTDPKAIVAAVAEAAGRGIATSALGIGEDYNEELLEAMAQAGDGSYTFVESPDQLPAFFEAELRGLKSVAGREVRLGLSPGPGIEIVSILNDFPASGAGTSVLPNLVFGSRQDIVLSIRTMEEFAATPGSLAEVLAARLEWTDPEDGIRRELRLAIQLPILEEHDFDGLSQDRSVAESAALLRIARSKREAMAALDRGDNAGIAAAMDRIRALLEALPASARTEQERLSLASLEEDLRLRKMAKFRKNVHYESYARGHAMDELRLSSHYYRKALYMVRDRVELRIGNLTGFACDAMVNSRSNGSGSGLDESIRRAGGPAFQAACEAIGKLAAGALAVTAGGELPARAVLHIRVPDWQGGTAGELEALSECYAACLRTAEEQGFDHVAFPILGSGGRGFPVQAAVSTALGATAWYLFSRGPSLRVSFVCPDGPAADMIREQLF